MRNHAITDFEHSFYILIDLFLCKITDELNNPEDLQFYYKGIARDTPKEYCNRLLKLYQVGKKQLFDVDVINKEEDERRTMGDKLADKVTEIAGSWGFIVGFCIFLIVWMIINTIMIVKFDEYPFILLNLILSCIAALQAPIIMMSQNRAAKKDSLRSLNDYKTDLKSELILEVLHEQMKDLQANQKKILKLLEENDVK